MQPQTKSEEIIQEVWSLQRKVQMQMRTEVSTLTEELTETEELAETRARTRVLSQACAEALALAKALEEAKALAEAEVRARASAELTLPRAQALVQALELGRTLALAMTRTREPARTREPILALKPMVDKFTYNEVLADSKLKDIIYSIKPDHRHSLACHLCRLPHTGQEYRWLIQIIAPITRLPPELLQEILHIIIDNASLSPLVLMRVCKHWYIQVTGIWASLKIGTRTSKDAVSRKLERNQRLLDVLVDTEIDRGDITQPERAYEAIFAAMEATSRWQSFVVEMFPTQTGLPEHLVNNSLQRCSDSLMSRLKTFRFKSSCEMSPLLDHLLHILGTSASEELTTVEINSPSVISFLAPTYSTMFHSIKVLHLDTPGLTDPVDFLPHLHQLESFTAFHLFLPNYHKHVYLPFVHTLRHLTLRAVSIQWMSGRTFHALESCTILFPLHRHVLRTFSTTLPKCKRLTFKGYPLNILDGISTHQLTYLSVTCSSTYKPRGNRQLVRFSSQALRESRLAPRILHISIEATNEAWIEALAFMSHLEELVIDNAQPSSLGANVLQSLVVHPVHANNLGTTATLGGLKTPVCPSLKRFGLRYRRWLRPSEHFDLIPEFISIIWSRQQSMFSLQSFQIWIPNDPQDPLELIEGPWINLEGFGRLANDGAIKGENLLQLMASRLVENMSRPSGTPSAACSQREIRNSQCNRSRHGSWSCPERT